MINHLFILFLVSFAFTACNSVVISEEGKPYVGWTEGELDIHHIYTGRGESNFLILPDSTSLLIDAGDWDPKDYPKMTPALPDTSRRSGEWIARYIMSYNPKYNKVDYLMISHFHNDHTGDSFNNVPITVGRCANYSLTGIMEVGEYIDFANFIDRGYPNYNYPLPILDSDVDNYRSFLHWHMISKALKPSSFTVGSLDEIKLLGSKSSTCGLFHIRNLCANGIIWNRSANSVRKLYDENINNKLGYQNENTKSIGLSISYGPFRYFTGGDLSGVLLDSLGNQIYVDELVAASCGPVDVCKANHHAYLDAMSEGFIKNIKAKHYIIPVWDYEHIQPSIMKRMSSDSLYLGERRIYATNLPKSLMDAYANETWMSNLCKEDGHLVVKVFDKGKQFKIYVLSADDESGLVKAVYGPFKSSIDNLEP